MFEPQLNHYRDITQEYGEQLPDFDNIYTAQAHYYEFRKDHLFLLEEISNEFNIIIDYSPKSLMDIEKLYFDLFKDNKYFDLQITIAEFETCMSIYLCEVLVRENPECSEWLVKEYPFIDNKFVMGIRYGRYHQYFQNMFLDHYVSHKDESEMILSKRYDRMARFCK
ncbi:hypothetical protein JOC75_003361 [Metabacillus crassostreae]|uniref:hypothetical protein n=1 Tax=Metabacillus crassostreae TaxID=929098 RepID=UPI00195E1FD1|nr:hypothetical protein [Metabacillus crassostreae]MBM7605338.1 hypothetical protein [Metabacillus crassostreae]